MINPNIKIIKKFYTTGAWDKAGVAAAVKRGSIQPWDYETIVGEKYESDEEVDTHADK